MKISSLLLVSLLLSWPLVARAAPQENGAEPPARYVLQVNGKATRMSLDKEISLNTKAGRTRFLLAREATRHFDKSGLKFDYPTDYGFEADLSDPALAIWTLSGRDSLLMLQRMPLAGPALLRDQMVKQLVKQYGSKNVVLRPASLFLNGRDVEGKRLRVSLAKQTLVQEIFAFSNPKYAFILMIQDAPERGKESAETKTLKAILSSSASY